MLGDIVHRARAYTEIAAAQAESGDEAAATTAFALALETAKEIPGAMTRNGVYSAIAIARAGDFAGALETVERLQHAIYKEFALMEIAVRLAWAGDTPGAMDILGRAGPSFTAARALVRIASPDPYDH